MQELRLYPEDSEESLQGFSKGVNNQICVLERSMQRIEWGLREGGRPIRKFE